MSDKVFGELGDLVEEQLLPIALRLAEALRGEGPDTVLDVLRTIPTEVTARVDHLPHGIMDAFAIVCAGMIDPDARLGELVGWTEPLQDNRVRAEQRAAELDAARRAHERAALAEIKAARQVAGELERLHRAGVRDIPAAEALAEQVKEQQQTIRGGMLRVIHGGRSA